MMWSNFHTHSNYCDGKGNLIDYVKRAENHGMISLGFSSHAPLPFFSKWCMKKESFSAYLSEINSLKNTSVEMEIYRGLEVDYIPQIISPSDFSAQLDYTIGSIHFVEQFEDGRRWEIDGQHAFFLEGLEKIFKNNIQDAIVRYLELTREMVSSGCLNVVGHLDKIKIQNIDNKFFNETDTWYQNEIKKTLKVVKAVGSIVEVNTRGIYQKKSSSTYPSPWILEIIHENNIPITLSSDAHHPDDLINQFVETAKSLANIGFEKISILKQGMWQSVGFNEHGIIITKN